MGTGGGTGNTMGQQLSAQSIHLSHPTGHNMPFWTRHPSQGQNHTHSSEVLNTLFWIIPGTPLAVEGSHTFIWVRHTPYSGRVTHIHLSQTHPLQWKGHTHSSESDTPLTVHGTTRMMSTHTQYNDSST